MPKIHRYPPLLSTLTLGFPAAFLWLGCSAGDGDDKPEGAGTGSMSAAGSGSTGGRSGTAGTGGMPTDVGFARCEFTATGDEQTGGVTDAYDYAFSSRPVPDAIRIGTAVAPQGEYSIVGCRGSQNFNDPKAEQVSFVFYHLGRLPDVVPVDATETDPNLLYCFAVYRDGNGNEWQCLAQTGSKAQGTCSLNVSQAEETGDPVAKFRVTASGHLECPAKSGNAKGTVGIDFTLSH
jgi:hypothetical protein